MTETTDQTIARLNKEIDEFRTMQLLMLADAHRDRGEESVALGYQWLAEKGRWPDEQYPDRARPERTWKWGFDAPSLAAPTWNMGWSFTLPSIPGLREELRPLASGFPSAHEALLAVARKIGIHIEEFEKCGF